jgi:hypothetical protein
VDIPKGVKNVERKRKQMRTLPDEMGKGSKELKKVKRVSQLRSELTFQLVAEGANVECTTRGGRRVRTGQ